MPATLNGKTEHGKTEHGKAVSARNATTHGLFARDIVLPALGEDPDGYRQVQNELVSQLQPANLLERHYVEKIAAASWRLRRLHRWQAQLFEDETLTEDERLDKLDKVLRHETHLHRQIDTAVKMLGKDVPQLYARRVRDQVLLDLMLSERECRESVRDETEVDLETRGRLRRIHKATEAAVSALSRAPLDTDTEPLPAAETCQNEPPSSSSPFLPREGLALAPGVGLSGPPLPFMGDGLGVGADRPGAALAPEPDEADWELSAMQNRQNEPGPWNSDDRRAFLASFPSRSGRVAACGGVLPQSRSDFHGE